MKRLLTTIFATGCLLMSMADNPSLPLIQNVNAYETMSLNGEWNYIVDVQEEGY
jgi:beta-glucuronidase